MPVGKEASVKFSVAEPPSSPNVPILAKHSNGNLADQLFRIAFQAYRTRDPSAYWTALSNAVDQVSAPNMKSAAVPSPVLQENNETSEITENSTESQSFEEILDESGIGESEQIKTVLFVEQSVMAGIVDEDAHEYLPRTLIRSLLHRFRIPDLQFFVSLRVLLSEWPKDDSSSGLQTQQQAAEALVQCMHAGVSLCHFVLSVLRCVRYRCLIVLVLLTLARTACIL